MVRRGDVYWVSLDPAKGHEQKGRRPVVVISPDAFNEAVGLPVVLPITTGGGFVRRKGFAVDLSNAGTAIQGVVRCDQPRVLDLSARDAEFIETLPERIVAEILARLRPLFS